MEWTAWGSNPGRGKTFFSSPKHPERQLLPRGKAGEM